MDDKKVELKMDAYKKQKVKVEQDNLFERMQPMSNLSTEKNKAEPMPPHYKSLHEALQALNTDPAFQSMFYVLFGNFRFTQPIDHKAYQQGPEIAHQQVPGIIEQDLWAIPPPMFYKLNVAVNHYDHGEVYSLGLGAIVRDHNGRVLAAVSQIWYDFGNVCPEALETAAAYMYSYGICYCLKQGYNSLIAETESMAVVRRCHDLYVNGFPPLQEFINFQPSQVKRYANGAAHIIASKAAIRNRFWTEMEVVEAFGSYLPF